MKIWIYSEGGQQGPFSPEELAARGIAPDTPVWYDGLPRWMPASKALSGMEGFEFLTETPEVAPEATVEPVIEVVTGGSEVRVEAAAGASAEEMPPTFLGWSLFLLICCCGSPFAIAALIGSIVTSIRNSQGDYEGARKASNVTEWLVMIAFSLGVVMLPLYYILF